MLQITVATLYFINKIFLATEKKAGWQIGILAAITGIFYFISLKSYIIMGLEAGTFMIFLFGLLNHNKEIRGEKWLYGIMFLMLLLLFVILKQSTFLEFSISAIFIIAIYCLAKRHRKLGWCFMAIGHIAMAYFTYNKGQYYFAFMQIMSVFVALYALYKHRKAFGETTI